MRTLPTEVLELVDRGDDVLVTCPSFAEEESEACIDLLTLDDPAGTNVLSVAFTQSPNDRFEMWSRNVDEPPARAGVVSVEADTRSTAGTAPTLDDDPVATRGRVTIDTVPSPENLTRLGVRIVERLDEWESEHSNRRTVVCFHSLTTLLQYVSIDRAYRFLQVLAEQSTVADATTHYHLDPGAHEEETVATLVELFDVVCAYDDGWTIHE
jgi:hypothetical protein